jgi:hypothetical protein
MVEHKSSNALLKNARTFVGSRSNSLRRKPKETAVVKKSLQSYNRHIYNNTVGDEADTSLNNTQ